MHAARAELIPGGAGDAGKFLVVAPDRLDIQRPFAGHEKLGSQRLALRFPQGARVLLSRSSALVLPSAGKLLTDGAQSL